MEDLNLRDSPNKQQLRANVRRSLIYAYDADGKPKKIKQLIKNHEIVMENDSRIAGKIRYNEFSHQIFLFGNVPWEDKNNCRVWGSHDDSALFSLIQCDYGLNSRQDFFDAMKNVAMRHRFHPIKDLLNSFQWDGKEHIKHLLPDYLGAEDTEYNYQVMRLWMLGAIARIYQPGIKFDYTMILQGAQGLGKSTLPRLMALDDTWFTDSLDNLDSEGAAQSLKGVWIIELAELKSLARTSGGTEGIKRFLTATQDRYREPYERRADTFQRSCVFMGTTNKSDFLNDETGNRRFLIVRTGEQKPIKSVFDDSVMDDIRAAWAEAVYIWKNEKPTLVLPESLQQEAEQAQNENMADDGSCGIILAYLEDQTKVCAIQIWQEALGQSGTPPKWKAAEINSVVSKVQGWVKIKNVSRFGKFGSQRGYEKVPTNKNEFVTVDAKEQSELPFD